MELAIVSNDKPSAPLPSATGLSGLLELLERERNLLGEIDDLRRQQTRLGELSTIPAAAEAELAALDASEREALAAWARTGNGEAPVASGEARAHIARRVAESRQRASHAVSASNEIDAKLMDLTAKISGVVSRINLAVEARLEGELEHDVAAATLAIAEARKAIANLLGYNTLMGERGRQRYGEDQDAGRAILSRLEKQTFQEIGDVRPDGREIDAAASQWRTRAAAARAENYE